MPLFVRQVRIIVFSLTSPPVVGVFQVRCAFLNMDNGGFTFVSFAIAICCRYFNLKWSFCLLFSLWNNTQQPGIFSNRLNAWQSEIFTELLRKGSFKLLQNIRYLFRNVKRFQNLVWFFGGRILRACSKLRNCTLQIGLLGISRID